MYQAQLSRHIDATQELPAIIPVPRCPFASSWYPFHIHKVAGARDMPSWAPIVVLFQMCPVYVSSVLSLSLDKSLVYIRKNLPGGSRVKTSPSRCCHVVVMSSLPCCRVVVDLFLLTNITLSWWDTVARAAVLHVTLLAWSQSWQPRFSRCCNQWVLLKKRKKKRTRK